MTTINILPIKWFGDRNAYMKSPVKIITVGLNPSDKEFRDKDGEPYCSSLRFPDYKVGDDVSLENARQGMSPLALLGKNRRKN